MQGARYLELIHDGDLGNVGALMDNEYVSTYGISEIYEYCITLPRAGLSRPEISRAIVSVHHFTIRSELQY